MDLSLKNNIIFATRTSKWILEIYKTSPKAGLFFDIFRVPGPYRKRFKINPKITAAGLLLLGVIQTNSQNLSVPSVSSAPPISFVPTTPDMVHPRFLDMPVPSGGITVRINPPILQWPVREGSNVRYEVRLSKDPGFKTEENRLTFIDIPWAMVNPHQKLDPGTWYWQYKKQDSRWSKTMSFNIDEDALPIVSPVTEQFLSGIPLSHPRVLTTYDDLLVLRGNNDSDQDITSLYDEANRYLEFILPNETGSIIPKKGENESQTRKFQLDASQKLGTSVYNSTLTLCQAYLVSGKEAYARKALEIALEVSGWDSRGISSLNDFGDARCMLTMALVYDTFYDRLNEQQKEKLLQAIKLRAAHFYSDWINQIESKILSGHVWQHILHYFLQTALAVYHHEPEAGNWLTYAYELFLARTPVLGGFDGGWVEGASYFRMNMETVLDIALTIQKFTGFDYVSTHPWYLENVKWMIYHVPPGSVADGFGDNTEEMSSPGKDYIGYATELSKLTGNPLAAWYAKECRKYESGDFSGSNTFRWIRITKTKDLPLPADTNIELPTGVVFKDVGLAALHTDVADTSNNLMVAFKSSPFGSYGHMLCDQNTFNILSGGEKVFYRTGYKVTMDDPHRVGWYRTTKSQNGILIDGEGQPYSNGSYGFISRFVESKRMAYVKGDATRAYKEGNLADKGVKKVWRHLFLLKPDIIIIYDELEADKEVEWSWLIHTHKEMAIDPVAGLFSVDLENTRGQGKFFSSRKINWSLSDTFAVPAHNWRGSRDASGQLKEYNDTQFHLTLTNRDKTSSIRYLTVLQVSPSADLINILKSSEPDENEEIHIEINDWKISANLHTMVSPGLEIREKKRGTVFSLYCDEIIVDGNKIVPKEKGSSMLVECTNKGKEIQEITDKLPYAMKQRVLSIKR